MDPDDLYISACATWLPPALGTEQAVAAGLCTRAEAGRAGMESVTVATDTSAPEMAARAARTALDRAGCAPADVGLLLHATLYEQGHDLWSPASYIQREALGSDFADCPAIEVRQVSNGGMASLQLAAAYLRAGTDRPAALLTAGDVFCLPGFDRWRSDPGTVYADGGAALVLSREAGFARLRGLATFSEPRLEGMHRGRQSFAPDPSGLRRRVDLKACQDGFMRDTGRGTVVGLVSGGAGRAAAGALAQAGLELGDIARFVLPHMGRRRLEASYFGPLGILPEQSTWPWSRGSVTWVAVTSSPG